MFKDGGLLYEKSYKKADELVEKAREGDPAARNMITELSMALDFIKENSGNLIRDELEYSKVLREQLDARNKAAGTVSAVLWAVVIVLGIAAAYLIVRNVLNSLNRLIAVSERISKGDLSIEALDTGSGDEIGKLYGAFNAMRNGLIDIIGVIAGNAKGISETVEKLNTIASETLLINQEMVKSIESNAAAC